MQRMISIDGHLSLEKWKNFSIMDSFGVQLDPGFKFKINSLMAGIWPDKTLLSLNSFTLRIDLNQIWLSRLLSKSVRRHGRSNSLVVCCRGTCFLEAGEIDMPWAERRCGVCSNIRLAWSSICYLLPMGNWLEVPGFCMISLCIYQGLSQWSIIIHLNLMLWLPEDCGV